MDRRSFVGLGAVFGGVAATGAGAGEFMSCPAGDPLLVDLERGSDAEIPLWPDGAPGGANFTLEEKIVRRDNPFGLLDRAAYNVSTPMLSRFDAAEPDGSALLIIPGGGYSYVVIDKEGYEGARWFSRRGVTVYVLRYRLPHQGWAAGPETPLQDAQRAMRVIRARAGEDGTDPARVSVMGFSAGGHLAGSLATRFMEKTYEAVDAADALDARPDAAALVYPVATMRAPHRHEGSKKNLIGENADETAIAAYSLERAPPAETPPIFLLHAADDAAVPVENSLALCSSLLRAGVAASLHVFESGGHGFGMRGLEEKPARIWPRLYLDWARAHGV